MGNREGFGGVDECLDSGCSYLVTSLGTISLFVKSQLGRRERGEARLDETTEAGVWGGSGAISIFFYVLWRGINTSRLRFAGVATTILPAPAHTLNKRLCFVKFVISD